MVLSLSLYRKYCGMVMSVQVSVDPSAFSQNLARFVITCSILTYEHLEDL